MKTCNACKAQKDVSLFGKNKSEKDGLMRQCKSCNNNRVNTYYAEDRSKSTDWYQNRRYTRKGITKELFDAKLAEQGGVCGICRELAEDMVADHDHSCCTGAKNACGQCFRGVLCAPCNRGLGQFNDDIKRLRAAVQYLS